jgi:hypothetical protein
VACSSVPDFVPINSTLVPAGTPAQNGSVCCFTPNGIGR